MSCACSSCVFCRRIEIFAFMLRGCRNYDSSNLLSDPSTECCATRLLAYVVGHCFPAKGMTTELQPRGGVDMLTPLVRANMFRVSTSALCFVCLAFIGWSSALRNEVSRSRCGHGAIMHQQYAIPTIDQWAPCVVPRLLSMLSCDGRYQQAHLHH